MDDGAERAIRSARESGTLVSHHSLGNAIGDFGAEYLSQTLSLSLREPELYCWTTLKLTDCGITADGVRHIAAALAANRTVTYLGLGGNDLRDEGCEYLAQMLRRNGTLEALHISFVGATHVGAEALAEALARDNVGLRALYLFDNFIGDEGALALAGSLCHNDRLERLNVGGCKLTETGLACLASALETSNSALTELYGGDNDVDYDGPAVAAIDFFLRENDAAPQEAEQRARCLLFCCMQLAPRAHEFPVPSIGAIPIPVMQPAMEHSAQLLVSRRFVQQTWDASAATGPAAPASGADKRRRKRKKAKQHGEGDSGALLSSKK